MDANASIVVCVCDTRTYTTMHHASGDDMQTQNFDVKKFTCKRAKLMYEIWKSVMEEDQFDECDIEQHGDYYSISRFNSYMNSSPLKMAEKLESEVNAKMQLFCYGDLKIKMDVIDKVTIIFNIHDAADDEGDETWIASGVIRWSFQIIEICDVGAVEVDEDED